MDDGTGAMYGPGSLSLIETGLTGETVGDELPRASNARKWGVSAKQQNTSIAQNRLKALTPASAAGVSAFEYVSPLRRAGYRAQRVARGLCLQC